MVGITGIGFYAEPANPRRVNGLQPAVPSPAPPAGEDAATVSESARLLSQAGEQQEKLQAERLDQIRRSLEQGTYRVQEVLLHVAARVARFVE